MVAGADGTQDQKVLEPIRITVAKSNQYPYESTWSQSDSDRHLVAELSARHDSRVVGEVRCVVTAPTSLLVGFYSFATDALPS